MCALAAAQGTVCFGSEADIIALTTPGVLSCASTPGRCCADVIGHVFAMPDSDEANDVGNLLSEPMDAYLRLVTCR